MTAQHMREHKAEFLPFLSQVGPYWVAQKMGAASSMATTSCMRAGAADHLVSTVPAGYAGR